MLNTRQAANHRQAYLDRRVTTDDVERLFGVESGEPITGCVMTETHRRADAEMLPYDLDLVEQLWGADNSSYWREVTTKNRLGTAGLIRTTSRFGLDASEYLRYITILFASPADPGPPTWAMVRKQMVLLQHWIYNLRMPGGSGVPAGPFHREDNVFQLHRESRANGKMFDHIASVADPTLTVDPARRIRVDRAALAARFPPTLPLWNATFHYAVVFLGLPPSLSVAIANQLAGPPGQEDRFGLRAFVSGNVAATGLCQPTYSADPLLAPRLAGWLRATGHPETGPFGPVDGQDLMDLIHQMTGWTAGDMPLTYYPPSSSPGASITVAELRDFLIGAGNALVNELDAPFADLMPTSDLCALRADIENGTLREHVEMEYTERILDDMATL